MRIDAARRLATDFPDYPPRRRWQRLAMLLRLALPDRYEYMRALERLARDWEVLLFAKLDHAEARAVAAEARVRELEQGR